MDPATAQLLISVGMDLAVKIVQLFRAGGAEKTAAEIEAILRRSDDIAGDIMATAQQELDKLAAKGVVLARHDPRLPLDG